MGVKPGQVSPTFPAQKFHLAENLGGIVLRSERPVAVLLVMGRHQNVFGNFNEMLAIAALVADNASGRLAGGDVNFFLHNFSVDRLNDDQNHLAPHTGLAAQEP